MKRKVSMPTAIVQAAQARYPQVLDAAVQHIGVNPPYGKEKIDARTRDQQLVRMLPEQIQSLAATDPQGYMNAQERLSTLRERAAEQPPLPAPDSYEGN